MERPPLRAYRRKRDFRRTPEPGGGPAGAHRLFVVQMHDARRRHYDLRLEMDGVLKSWAVPKGPSYDPAEKRLAVQVEDHPLEYADFEGVIPVGEYGAGPVMVWDYGTWEPVGDAREGYHKGTFHFRLHGARLLGEWVLARMGGGAANEERNNWLLLKVEEPLERARQEADKGNNGNEVSVLSGRTIGQIRDSGGYSQRPGRRSATPSPSGAPFPSEMEPQLATLAESAPRGPGWLHEIKFDGYRALARVDRGKIALLSRNGKNWTRRFGAVAQALGALPLRDGWIDGEISVLLPDGRTSFSALQQALSEERDRDLVYFVFDLLYRDGADLRRLPLRQRKAALADLLSDQLLSSPLRFADHLLGEGEVVFQEACRLGLEGLVSKRANAPYHAGRGRDWIKVKCLQRQEFVIGGFSSPAGARSAFGALLVGVYRDGQLIYSGRVGTGFNEKVLHDLYTRLAPLRLPASPFVNPVPKGRGEVTWVRPEIVAEVAFSEWTRDNILRQPVYQGLREDKPALEVVREQNRFADKQKPSTPPQPKERSERVAGLRISHANKTMFPEPHLTKRDLAFYYEEIADYLLPDLVHRPLTLLRCPEGQQMPCFFQKHATEALPAGIVRVPIIENGGRGIYLAVEAIRGVVALVQMGVLEIHTWGAHADNPDAPDRMVFDLDPDEGLPWDSVVAGVRLLREALVTLGLTPFLRTTGGKGLHLVVPLARRHSWSEVKAFAHALARAIVHETPQAYTINPAISARRGKLYIDYLRNGRGATAIANYSTRARSSAPIAVPLRWDELGIASDAYHVTDLRARLADLSADPWNGYRDSARVITKAMKRAVGMK